MQQQKKHSVTLPAWMPTKLCIIKISFGKDETAGPAAGVPNYCFFRINRDIKKVCFFSSLMVDIPIYMI